MSIIGQINVRTVSVYEQLGYRRRMDMSKELEKAKQMATIAYKALTDKKGEDVRVIQITEVASFADYFVIGDGNNPSQISALVDNVEEQMSKAGFEPKRIEGVRNSNWVLMDYGDIIVHVFSKEDRLFYDLERIWKDGKELTEADLEK